MFLVELIFEPAEGSLCPPSSGTCAGSRSARRRGADGELLPYALHFALVSRDEVPLARFAQDWGRAFADLPGWRPAWQKRQFDDDALFKTLVLLHRPPAQCR
jgi:hypothetical protein